MAAGARIHLCGHDATVALLTTAEDAAHPSAEAERQIKQTKTYLTLSDTKSFNCLTYRHTREFSDALLYSVIVAVAD